MLLADLAETSRAVAAARSSTLRSRLLVAATARDVSARSASSIRATYNGGSSPALAPGVGDPPRPTSSGMPWWRGGPNLEGSARRYPRGGERSQDAHAAHRRPRDPPP